MNIKSKLEFQALVVSLEKTPYIWRSLERAKFAYALLEGQCKKVDVEGVNGFITINVDPAKKAETEMVPTGYVFRGKWYTTGSRQACKGGSMGNIVFGFVISNQYYIIYDCQMVFGDNESSQDMPMDQELGFLSDRILPRITHTMEVLKFLRDQNLLVIL